MKRNRIIYMILWILSLIWISFFGGTVSYGFFITLTFLPFVLLVYLLAVYCFFRIYQQIDNKRLVAGRMVPFYFTLKNEYHFGFCSIKVCFYSSFSDISGLDDDTEYELLPKSGIKKHTQLVCRYRGEYEVGIKTVEIVDFFRLIRIRYKNKEPLRVFVRPDLIKLPAVLSLDDSQNMFRNSLINPSIPDTDVRKYCDGDDIRMINWKASARTGELIVRKMIAQEREAVSIVMGSERFSEDMPQYLPLENKILELSLALAYFFIRNNIPLKFFYLDADRLHQVNVDSLEGFDAFYEEVASVSFKKENKESVLLETVCGSNSLFDCRSSFFVIHEWNADVTGAARILRENNVYTVACVVNDDMNLKNTDSEIPGFKFFKIGTHQDIKEAGI